MTSGEGKGGKGVDAAKTGLSCPEIAAIASSWTSRTDRTCNEPQAHRPSADGDPCGELRCELHCADRRAPCESPPPWLAAAARARGKRRSYRLVDRCLTQNRRDLCAAVAANKQTNKQTNKQIKQPDARNVCARTHPERVRACERGFRPRVRACTGCVHSKRERTACAGMLRLRRSARFSSSCRKPQAPLSVIP